MTVPVFDPVLPRLYTSVLPANSEWWHCYTMRSPHFPCGPLKTYAAAYRFALVQDVPMGTVARDSYYIGETARAALFETILRGNPPDADGSVRLRPGQLKDRGLVKLRLKENLPVIRLDRPTRARLGVLEGTSLDQDLDRMTRMKDYLATQEFAGLLDAQCRADLTFGMPLPGLMWASRQVNTDLVAVLFTPPNREDRWEEQAIIELDTPPGLALLDEALRAGAMRLAADPRVAPPPGTGP